MNVRVFVLIGMTVFFGILWSSDRQYQEAQIAAAQTARRQPVVRVAVTALRPVVAKAVHSGSKARYSGNARLVVNELFGPEVEYCVSGVVEWGDRMRSRLEEESCMFRWQSRRALFFAQRHARALIRQQMNWREIAVRLGRDAIRRIEASKSAAAPGTAETR